MMRMSDYQLRVWLSATNDDKSTDDLVAFIIGGTRRHLDTRGPMTPFSSVCTYPEHSTRFPRHRLRLHPGRPPLWTVDFVVAEPDDDVSLIAKLCKLFGKNGWDVVTGERLTRDPTVEYEGRLTPTDVRKPKDDKPKPTVVMHPAAPVGVYELRFGDKTMGSMADINAPSAQEKK